MSVVLEGFLQKQSGGLFLQKKQKWAVLKSDGTLSLSRKPELSASSIIHIYEVDDVVYRDEDCSISFSSVYDGSIIKAYKFYALETPTFEEWAVALEKIRQDPSEEYENSRSKYRESVRESVFNFPDPAPHPELLPVSTKHNAAVPLSDQLTPPLVCHDARVTVTDSELERNVDPILLIQSSGEPISKSGYVKKRGGAYGGNTSFKKRFFVLTIFGRVVYFADHKKTQALGQFSLVNATIQHMKQQEISVVTPTRVWFLKFESEASRLEWTEKLDSIAAIATSSAPSSPEKATPSSTLPPSKDTHTEGECEAETKPAPRFRRNVSLLVKQKSNFHGLGYTTTEEEKSGQLSQSEASSVSVACVTWNLSESLPKMQQCRFMRQYRQYQIVVVGVQECQSVMYHSFSARQLSPLDIWLAMVKSLMGDPFTLVASRSMGAIHICVFVREDVVGYISDVSTAFVPCGLGNVMYNKGAVAVAMKYSQTSFGFVCAHLAANIEKNSERNQNFHRISLMLVDQLRKTANSSKNNSVLDVDSKTYHKAGLFVVTDNGEEDVYTDDDPNSTPRNVKSGGGGGPQVDSLDCLAREFDRCFFLGDLNYRVDAGKDWIEHHLRMAEAMRKQEKADLQDTQDSVVDDSTVDVADRSSEKNIEKMLNLIQVGDYGTDDDSDDESVASPLPSPTASCVSSAAKQALPSDVPVLAKTSSGKITSKREGIGRGPITEDDLRALKLFKEETKLTTSQSVLEFLLTYDQLSRERGKATVFRGFDEGPIQFKPSYKFDPFTETYDTGRKGRAPAWCDRVLFTPAHTTLDQYRCIHGQFHSDHRAVVAVFTVEL